MRSASSRLCCASSAASISTPWRSMRASTALTGISMCSYTDSRPGSLLQPRVQRLVHLQRHLAVLARVAGRALDVDLRERDLVRALAAHLLVAQALAAEVALGQAFQAVQLVRLEHVALQQRVVAPAAHRDAVVGEHVGVVLDVLADLAGCRRPRATASARPAPRRAAAARARRGSCAPAARRRPRPGSHRERDADDARAHRVERIGLGVERGQRRRAQARDPRVEPLARQTVS